MDFSSTKFSSHAQDMASHSNLLRGHTENINTFISTHATFNSQICGLEPKSEDFLKYLQVERQMIDNVNSNLNTLEESGKKAQPKIKEKSEILDYVEANINVKDKAFLKSETVNKAQPEIRRNSESLDDINAKHIDDTSDGSPKTVANFEGRHVETVEKMDELTALPSNDNSQVQVNKQELKIVKQNSNDLNQIINQIQNIENIEHLATICCKLEFRVE